MKTVLSILTALLISFSVNAQSSFDKFEDIEGVTTVSVSSSMFRLMSKFGGTDPENQEYFDMIKTLNGLKVFITEDSEVAEEMAKVAEGYIRSSKMEELMRVKEDDSNVKIYVLPGADEDHVNELLMLATDGGSSKQTVLMSLSGNIDLNQLAVLTEKMNLPAATNVTID